MAESLATPPGEEDSLADSPQLDRQRPKASRRTFSGRTTLFLAVLGFVSLVGGAGFLAWSVDFRDTGSALVDALSEELDEREAEAAEELVRRENERVQLEYEKKREEARQALLDQERDAMAADGFEPAGEGLYYRWARDNEFNCGYWDCAVIYVVTLDKECPQSVYVEANVMSGATAVGLTNDSVGGLARYSSAAFTLEDFVGGDSFQLTAISCY